MRRSRLPSLRTQRRSHVEGEWRQRKITPAAQHENSRIGSNSRCTALHSESGRLRDSLCQSKRSPCVFLLARHARSLHCRTGGQCRHLTACAEASKSKMSTQALRIDQESCRPQRTPARCEPGDAREFARSATTEAAVALARVVPDRRVMRCALLDRGAACTRQMYVETKWLDCSMAAAPARRFERQKRHCHTGFTAEVRAGRQMRSASHTGEARHARNAHAVPHWTTTGPFRPLASAAR
jgi:hypothetical protein